MESIMIGMFVVGYLLIAFESPLMINKSTFALIMCGLLWTVYALMSPNAELHHDILVHLGDTSEILIFLIGAMAIVEHIDRYGGFNLITGHITAKDKKRLLWILSVFTFFMSAVLDNMTTTIIMVMMIKKLLRSKQERWMFAGVLVLAANSGGAWSPIGDVTTIMLWMNNLVTSSKLILNLLIPCIVSVIIPLMIATRFIDDEPVHRIECEDANDTHISTDFPGLSKAMLIIGVCGLLFVPIFKTLTGLPPFMGMMISLGVLWLVTEVLILKYKIDDNHRPHLTYALRNVDMASILFFLGILMSVSALQQVGVLGNLANYMNNEIKEPYTIATATGILSSIVDNVPLVAACIKMFAPLAHVTHTDPYLANFAVDGLFWHLLTFTAGVGGSLLIIGSAAGVVAMGIEEIPFFWYMKRISFLALIGYLAGIFVIWLESLIPFFHL